MVPSYPHTLHWPESLSVHRSDHYHCDPDVFVGREVIITEKLDGGIASIWDGKVYARSSGAPTNQPWFSYLKSVTLPKFQALSLNLCVVGEDLYGIHSIEYDPLPDSFFLFHVLDRFDDNIGTARTNDDWFWDWDSVVKLVQHYNVNHVPVLYSGHFSSRKEITDWFMDHIGKPSVFGPVCEGFVMRFADLFSFEEFGISTCKFVQANHVQTNNHWRRNWRTAKIVSL